MQEVFYKFAIEHLFLHIVLITLCTAAILLAMIIDLVAGIGKAKQNGIATTSRGLKMTSKKAVRYFVPFIVLTLLDMVASFLLPAPFFSMIWAGYVILCEFWSVRENAWDKAEIDKQAKTIRTVIANKDDIAKAVAAAMLGDNKSKDTPTEGETE